MLVTETLQQLGFKQIDSQVIRRLFWLEWPELQQRTDPLEFLFWKHCRIAGFKCLHKGAGGIQLLEGFEAFKGNQPDR